MGENKGRTDQSERVLRVTNVYTNLLLGKHLDAVAHDVDAALV